MCMNVYTWMHMKKPESGVVFLLLYGAQSPPLRQHDGLASLVGRLASGIASYLLPCWTYRTAEPSLMGSGDPIPALKLCGSWPTEPSGS